MSHFERWLKKIKWDNKTAAKLGGFSVWGKGYRQGLENGYYEALKYVLSIDSGFCSCGCPNDSADNPSVLSKIEQELENVKLV